MEIQKGTVVGWNKKNNSLVVLPHHEQRIIQIEQSEFSIYSETIAHNGIPFEVFLLTGKDISFAKLENGKYSRKILMSDTMAKLEIGDIFQATVISLKRKNVFLEYSGCFFYCGPNEITRKYFQNASEYFYIGEKIRVKLRTKGSSTRYAEVSYRQAFPDSLENYHHGDFCTAKVAGVNNTMKAYFMEVNPAVYGLLDFQRCPISFPPLSYGDIVTCKVKCVTKSGLKLYGKNIVHRAK